jgi:foldase protein PrsA
LCVLAILAAGVGVPTIIRLLGRESGAAAVIVNGEVIARDEVYLAMYRQLGRATVDRLISRVLIRQAAAQRGVAVEIARIEEELAGIRAQFESEEHFQQALAAYGLDQAALRQEVELDLLARALVEREITITDQQARARYDERRDVHAGTFEEEREEIVATLRQEAASDRMAAWLAELRETASIIDYSEQP